jgi:hypothetical protein
VNPGKLGGFSVKLLGPAVGLTWLTGRVDLDPSDVDLTAVVNAGRLA